MNNAQRAALAPAGTRWYGLWTGSGWLRTLDEVWFWGPKSVMMAMAEDFNNRKRMSHEDPNSRIVAKAFPDPELDEAEAHDQEPEPPPASDTSFKW